ncbi:MAG: helix-turn-helix domain-containing protein [Desulfovibrionaceae bacterium]
MVMHTIADVCELLKVHERTVYRWLKSGQLQGVKAGKLWRIPEAALDAFLRGATATPPAQPSTTLSAPSAVPPVAPLMAEQAVAPGLFSPAPSERPDMPPEGAAAVTPPSAEPSPSAQPHAVSEVQPQPECGEQQQAPVAMTATTQPAADEAVAPGMRRVRIRYNGVPGYILYNESSPADFQVEINDPVKERIIAHLLSERSFKAPETQGRNDYRIDRARAVDNANYFTLALCTLHVNTGVRVEW